MKIITRRAREGVVIGDNVRITVLEVGQGRVRLGIEDEKQEPAYREETVYLNRSASGPTFRGGPRFAAARR